MSIEKHTFATVIEASTTGDEPSITISTCAVDREHDEIVAKGGDFTAYLKNPVVLFGHDHRALPVGATTRLDVESGRGITCPEKSSPSSADRRRRRTTIPIACWMHGRFEEKLRGRYGWARIARSAHAVVLSGLSDANPPQ